LTVVEAGENALRPFGRPGDRDPAVPGRVAVPVRRTRGAGLADPPRRAELRGGRASEVGGELLGRPAHPLGHVDRAGHPGPTRRECVHDRAPDEVRRRARYGQECCRHETARGALGHGDTLATRSQLRSDALGGLRQLGRERDHRRRVRAMSDTIGPFSTAGEMLAALDAKEISSVELVEMHLARIEKLDEALNAIPVRTAERALEAARHADDLRAAGESRPLLGLPMTLKESTEVAGLPQSAGIVPF